MRGMVLTLALVALALFCTLPTSTVAAAIRKASTPTTASSSSDSKASLARRAPLRASGTLIQEPPTMPPGWGREPTTTRQPPQPTNPFAIRPPNDPGIGHAPPPRNLDPRPGPPSGWQPEPIPPGLWPWPTPKP